MARPRSIVHPLLGALAALALATSFSTLLAACGDDGGSGEPPDLSVPQTADLSAPVSDDGGEDCTGDGGCYACPPKTDPQFLNQCTGLGCSHFDNQARLPLLGADGTLPPLP